jgi:hypothetical protein
MEECSYCHQPIIEYKRKPFPKNDYDTIICEKCWNKRRSTLLEYDNVDIGQFIPEKLVFK